MSWVQANGCALYCGDAREVMGQLQQRGVRPRLCVTDPPYPLTSGGGGGLQRVTKSGHKVMSGGWMKAYSNSGKLFEMCPIEEWLKSAFDLLATDAEIYCMSDAKNLRSTLVEFAAVGFELHNVLTWHKRTCTANRWYMKDCEYTAYGWKGAARRIADCSSKQLVSMPQRDETEHPTEKPVELFRHYIANSCRPGELVIDPFMGSGSSGVAAVRAGRPYIGIELSREYFDMAVERISKAQPHVDLFASQSTPRQVDIEELLTC